MILYFDTETTGLCPGRIVQLSYIMQSETETRAKNFFFAVRYVEPSAVAVHGFTPQKLFELSGGKTFSCDIDEIADDFESADLVVSHNFPFDEKFMSAEYGYENRIFHYNNSLCSMRFWTDLVGLKRSDGVRNKFPKLTELARFFELYDYDITRKTAELFGGGALGFHDARFDTATLFMCANEAIARGVAGGLSEFITGINDAENL